MAERKNWPSDDEVVPSPQAAATGRAWCASMVPASARLVGLGPDVRAGGPDQLVAGDALARGRHPAEAEVGGVGQDGGEQRVLVLAPLAGAQVGEGRREARHPADLVQHLGDARGGQHRVEPVREGAGLGRRGGLDRGDAQAPVPQLDTLQLAAPEPEREALQPSVDLPAASGEPLVGRPGQPELRHGRRHGGGRQQVAVGAPVVGRALDPNVAGTELVAQGREDGGLVQAAAVRSTLLPHQPPPVLAERHGRVRRHVALAGPVQLAQQPERRQHRVVVARGPELQRLDQRGREPAQRRPATGGADQGILLGEIGQRFDLAAHAQQPGPTHGLVHRLEGVAVALLGGGERRDRAVEQAHQPTDVARAAGVAPPLGVARPREQAADQPIRHVERRVGQAGLEVEDQGDQQGAAAARGVAPELVGIRGVRLAHEPAQPLLVDACARLGGQIDTPDQAQPVEQLAHVVRLGCHGHGLEPGERRRAR